MPEIKPIVAMLSRTRADLLAAAEAFSADLWTRSPKADEWSAADVISHLTSVEAAITGGAAKMIRSEPRRVPFWRKLHPPVVVVRWRFPRFKTPIPLERKLLGEKEEMLARLQAERTRTEALLEQAAGRDLRAYYWPHPFFGPLNFYDWFRLMAHHEVRHTKQLREIIEFFQK
jgi:hypothetical protein